MLGPHAVLAETEQIVKNLSATSFLTSDHYTNYINLDGQLPRDRQRFLEALAQAQSQNESEFRPFFVGAQ